jgi:hypothetical protein
MGIDKKISKEEWIELSKKLRNRVCAHFNPDQLKTIDEFIQLAGQGASSDPPASAHSTSIIR